MYVPPHARENRIDVLREAIENIGFGTLVTIGGTEPVLTHLPMLYAPGGPLGRIVGHISRANTQWQGANGTQGVAAFVGPSFYVSPNSYATKALTGKVVPTWNYIAVEARGPIEFYDERERLLQLVETLTNRHEALQAEPWSVRDAPDDYIDGQLRGIVGFELAIGELAGAWKLSRNKDAADRSTLAQSMEYSSMPAVRALAELVRRGDPPGSLLT
ncbi:MAG: FMN-binding negative transcriptional regulator [Candidatus Velthaea sp.]